MHNGELTYCDAEKAYNDGSYKSLSDDILEKYHKLCINVSGVNLGAVDRIRMIGGYMREELLAREHSRENQQTYLSAASDKDSSQNLVVQSSLETSWNEERLLQLIKDGIEENPSIEYKAADALERSSIKIKEITKDVSAFANAAGGTLIYGIKEFQNEQQRHLPEKIDPIDRDKFSREWLEQIIAQIRPRIPELKIHPVQLGTGLDHTAYVVEIPQGSTAHQANDYRYYRRYNFESVPMLDHEIRDVMNRKYHPKVSLELKLVIYPRPTAAGKRGALIIKILNQSDVFVRYAAASIYAPIRLKGVVLDFNDAILDKFDGASAYRLAFSNHANAPLFPRANLQHIFHFEFAAAISPEPENQMDRIKWCVFADSMPARSGEFHIDDVLEDKRPISTGG